MDKSWPWPVLQHGHPPALNSALIARQWVLTFISSHCGLPLSLMSKKSLRLYPMYYSVATSPPSHIQFDFWTQVQDPPFIPIQFHLVRFRLSLWPVETTLDLGPDSCLPLCFMSSANLISVLSMFWSKSLMERLGSTEARTWPVRSLQIAL